MNIPQVLLVHHKCYKEGDGTWTVIQKGRLCLGTVG